jgi:hypothetical protein
MPFVGECHAALQACEQRDTERLLQRLYLMADRRLRDPQLEAGARKAAEPRGRFKCAKRVEGQSRHFHFRARSLAKIFSGLSRELIVWRGAEFPRIGRADERRPVTSRAKTSGDKK